MNNLHLDRKYIMTGTTNMDAVLAVEPHYTDERFRQAQTLFCSEPDNLTAGAADTVTLPDCHYDYSDRLWEWGYDKAEEAVEVANKTGAARKTARWYQAYLGHFYGKPIVLKHILAGWNWGNGYPYQVFGTTDLGD